MTIGVKTDFVAYKRPENKLRGLIFDLSTSGKFDAFIMVCIVLNILTMAMTFEGSVPEYDKILENINLFFTSVFISETTFKIISLGFKGKISHFND
jgi:hypothetical protein